VPCAAYLTRSLFLHMQASAGRAMTDDSHPASKVSALNAGSSPNVWR
jgi:hypothetical protein